MIQSHREQDSLAQCWNSSTQQQSAYFPVDTVHAGVNNNYSKVTAQTTCKSSLISIIDDAESSPALVQSIYWLRVAFGLSSFSVIWELLEGSVSIFYGSQYGSMSLTAFGTDSLIELLSASLIVWRFYHQLAATVSAKNASLSRATDNHEIKSKEKIVTLSVGVLLGFLSITTVIVSIRDLLLHDAPITTVPGIIISAVSFAVMAALYFSKTLTGVRLNSSAVLSDAICTWCCMQLSFCVLVSSITYHFYSHLWWLDSAFSLLISVFIFNESIGMIKAVYTGHDSCCALPARDTWLIQQIKTRIIMNNTTAITAVENGCCNDDTHFICTSFKYQSIN